MALKFEADESLADGTRRMALELLDLAMGRMTRLSRLDKDVHETRKSFKKMRGLLRLTRYAMGEFCYQRENAFFRDTGKRLSPLREGFVRVKTLDRMIERYRKALGRIDFGELRGSMVEAHRQARTAFRRDTEARADLLEHLAAARAAVADWPLEDDDEALVHGIARIYRQGRKEGIVCRRHPDTEHLHDWRKRVKYLWYHVRILSPCWPPVMDAYADALSTLGEWLGDDHDLADFERELADGALHIDAARLDSIRSRIGADRKDLQSRAFDLANRVYAESPSAFEARLAIYWRSWRRGA